MCAQNHQPIKSRHVPRVARSQLGSPPIPPSPSFAAPEPHRPDTHSLIVQLETKSSPTTCAIQILGNLPTGPRLLRRLVTRVLKLFDAAQRARNPYPAPAASSSLHISRSSFSSSPSTPKRRRNLTVLLCHVIVSLRPCSKCCILFEKKGIMPVGNQKKNTGFLLRPLLRHCAFPKTRSPEYEATPCSQMLLNVQTSPSTSCGDCSLSRRPKWRR